jgi:hypothetical protein
MNQKKINHPFEATHDYCAFKKCGCLVGLAVDMGDRETAKMVGEFIRGGCYVERHPRTDLPELLKDGIGCHCPKDQASLL